MSEEPFGCGASAARALGTPQARATLRATAEDFQVFERLSFAPKGEGNHWLLEVEKSGLTTRDAVAALARHFGVRRKDVGYAGLKDKQAVARQWLSVPLVPGREPSAGQNPARGLRVTAVHRHDRKLRQGGGAGNRFVLRLTRFEGDRADVEERLRRCASQGIPNYFGPQRFGIGDGNVLRARAMFSGERPCNDRFLRGLLISAARAELFNRLLSIRVRDGTWNGIIDGDVINLAGSRSWFRCENCADADLVDRARVLDIHPTGPLWGEGDPPSDAVALALEREAVACDPVLRDGLAGIGAKQDRRALRCPVQGLTWQWSEQDTLELEFSLGSGSYATAVVRELVAGNLAALPA
ncbi:MAG: tRNA pseudouridine(13) synthase TruD [Pseudomonadota bacterium]|nr:tRNA pseudouridine(13) synthase TruD [Pseudomonadota bacterium]